MTVAQEIDYVSSLREFANYRKTYLSGDEKGEAQVFCDRLFKAMGLLGVAEAGAHLEWRVPKNDDKGVTFADLVYKPHCVVEMKRAGTSLQKHFRQLFSYWQRIVPNRPRYAILCNFDEFWVYDFDTQIEEPVDRIPIENLPDKHEALSFLKREPQKPLFANDLVQVTREAAASVAAVFRSLFERGVEREDAQRFILQCVMAMFAEDVALLPGKFFTRALYDSTSAAEVYDNVGSLFHEMNSPGVTKGGRNKGTPYFNGGLFSVIAVVELSDVETQLLKKAADHNWSAVRPEIFGTLFEQSMDAGERHALGAHYTSQADIMRIVGPSIVDPWVSRIDSARTISELEAVLSSMNSYRVLDPACGSGNFLYVAYRELRRLEHDLVAKIVSRRKSAASKTQTTLSLVTPDQFHGIDKNPFAVEIAKVTMLLAKKLSADELDEEQPVLPLDNLDESLVAADALFSQWPRADAIVGNPPYLGRRRMRKELGAAYCARLEEKYPAVSGVSDFVCYWFPIAHDHLPAGGRAGLVGTNSIRQGSAQDSTLRYISEHSGVITEAVSSIPWEGSANVHVSIVNWVKGDPGSSERVLWTENGSARIAVPSINIALSPNLDVSDAASLRCNQKPKRVFQGQTPGITEGYELDEEAAAALLKEGKEEKQIVHRFLGGTDLLHKLEPESWIIDIPLNDMAEARSRYPKAMRHLEDRVLPIREERAVAEDAANMETLAENPKARVNHHHRNFLQSWWKLAYRRSDLLQAVSGMQRFVAVTRTASNRRRPAFTFVDSVVHVADSVVAFPFDDDYSLGILMSDWHVRWFRERCLTLKADPNYTSRKVFDSFPWPQQPTQAQAEEVAKSAAEIFSFQRNSIERGVTLAEQYDVLSQPGRTQLRTLHDRLDDKVAAAYGFEKNVEPLGQLLSQNLAIAEFESNLQDVLRPGPPYDGLKISEGAFGS